MSRDERGQTTVLIVGLFLVVALTVAVVVDASAAYLRRQALASVADATALAAADGVRAEQAYTGRLDASQAVDIGAARRHAAAYLAQIDAHRRFDHLSVQVGATDGAVTVRLSAPLQLPLAPPGWEDHPIVTADAAAVVVDGQ